MHHVWLISSTLILHCNTTYASFTVSSISAVNFSNDNARICSKIASSFVGIQVSLAGTNLQSISSVSWGADVPYVVLDNGTNSLTGVLSVSGVGSVVISATVDGTNIYTRSITIDATLPTVSQVGRIDNSPVCSNGQTITLTATGANALKYEWYYATAATLPNVFSLTYRGESALPTFNFVSSLLGSIDIFAVAVNESCADTIDFPNRYTLNINNIPDITYFKYQNGRGANQNLFCKGGNVAGLFSVENYVVDTVLRPLVQSNVTNYVYTYEERFRSLTSGLIIDQNTGNVTVLGSNTGTFEIEYAIVSIPGCPQVTAVTTITIDQINSFRPNLSYPKSLYCTSEADTIKPSFTALGYDASTLIYSAGTNELRILASNGYVLPKFSTEANYTIRYTATGLGGCSNFKIASDPFTLSIRDSTQGYLFSYFDSFDNVTVCRTGLEYPIVYKNGVVSEVPAGGYFKNFNTIGVAFSGNDSIIGRIDLELLEPNRSYELGLFIPASSTCKASFVRGFVLSITTDSLISPSFSYGSDLFCIGDLKNETVKKIEVANKPGLPGEYRVFTSSGQTTSFLTIDRATGALDYENRGPVSTDIRVEFTPNAASSSCKFRPATTLLKFRRRSVSEYTISLTLNPASSCMDNPTIAIRHTLTGGYFFGTPEGVVWQDSIAGVINNAYTIPNRLYNIFYRIPESAFCSEAISTPYTLTPIKSVQGFIEPVGFKVENGICDNGTFSVSVSGANGRFLGWIVKSPSFDFKFIVDENGDRIVNPVLTYTVTGEDLEVQAVNRLEPCRSAFSNSIFIKRFAPTQPGFVFQQFKEICNDTNTSEIYIKEQLGTLFWQFSKDSLGVFDTLKTESGVIQRDTIAISKPTFNYGERYFYRANVKNGPCPFRLSNVVGVRYCDPSKLAPNAFVPTIWDPQNARWRLDKMRLRDETIIRIYNRYGVVVHTMSGQEAKTNPWDGSGLPSGTYWYIIDRKDGTQPITGSVSIIR